MNVSRPSVVAGLSRTRSPLSGLVVGWAADEAAARGLPLHLLHAQEWPHTGSGLARPRTGDLGPGPPGVDGHGSPGSGGPGHDHDGQTTGPGRSGPSGHSRPTHLRAGGEAVLDAARQAAQADREPLEVTTELAGGRAVHALREAAEHAAVVVVGARRFGGLQDALSGGGKGHALVGHLPCPLALVPEAPGNVPAGAPVVVGVDGSPGSLAAIDLAFAEAAAAGAELVAVEVRAPRDAAWPEFLEDSALHLSQLLAGHRERYPDVAVRHENLTGDPAATLASAARYARCLVVGSRGRGGFRGMLLGSTSRSLVHRTYCPLLVTPAPAAA